MWPWHVWLGLGSHNLQSLFFAFNFPECNWKKITRRQSEGQLYPPPPSMVALTLSWPGWKKSLASSLTELDIWVKFNENPSRGKGNEENQSITFTCDLDLEAVCWVIDSAYCLTKPNIWPTFYGNPSMGKGDMERTRNLRLEPVIFNYDLTLSLHGWVMGSDIISLRRTFDQGLIKIFPGVKEICNGHEIKGSNSWPSIVTITLSQHGWIMDSVHCLTEANIRPKFNENPSRRNGDMEWTRN